MISLCVSSAVLMFGCFDFGSLEQSGAVDGGNDASDASSFDAAINDGSGTPAEAGCLVAPTVGASDTAFCAAFAAAGSACESCEACRQTDLNSCAALAAATSTGFKKAFVACQDSGTDCMGYPFVAEATACETQHVSVAPPSFAQTNLKNTYCAHCADAGANGIPCNSFYYYSDGGPTIAGGLLVASDDILNMVTANCASSCQVATFAVCAAEQFCGAAPKGACPSDICN